MNARVLAGLTLVFLVSASVDARAADEDTASTVSQFIIATHSPILLAYPRAKIVLFDGSGLTEVQYEDTEHFAVTRDFLNGYQHRLKELLADDDDEK